MNVVYFGTDLFIDMFRYFCSNHNVMALYTYHNDEDYFSDYLIVKEAKELNIPVHYEPIAKSTAESYIEKNNCELFFSAEYDKIIPIPENIRFRGINTHASFLPQGRSYYPVENAFRKEVTETGVTMHKLVQEPDRGDILLQRRADVLPSDDSIDIYIKLSKYAVEMLQEMLCNFDKIWNGAVKQTSLLPYWIRPSEERMLVSHDMTVRQAEEIFRCYNKMSKVNINGTLYYIVFLTKGNIRLMHDVQWLSQHRVLYNLRDGHIRLELQVLE